MHTRQRKAAEDCQRADSNCGGRHVSTPSNRDSDTHSRDSRFRLARLYIDSLLDKRTARNVKATLGELTKGAGALDVAYGEALQRIESQLEGDRELAKKSFALDHTRETAAHYRWDLLRLGSGARRKREWIRTMYSLGETWCPYVPVLLLSIERATSSVLCTTQHRSTLSAPETHRI
jgi:hypothetical protein